MSSNVFFTKDLTKAADLLTKLAIEERISWQKDLPIKIHPGAIGNTAYIRPDQYTGIISYLKKNSVNPYFMETCMGSGTGDYKEKEFTEHGFTQIPHLIADGSNGDDHIEVKNPKGKHFSSCLIARKLALSDQVLVISHFKGHGMAGFGGAIKMLGIGFASGQAKTIIHSAKNVTKIDWSKSRLSSKKDEFNILDWNPEEVTIGTQFREKFAEYATAAAMGKKHVYLNFATNLAPDCDCNGDEMVPVYPDLGVFASTDPVAIDKAVFDMLQKRESKTPFAGGEIFEYAMSLGLGSTDYSLKPLF